jgi:hypothetical protein
MTTVSGNRRALIAAHLGGDAASFLHRVRLTDLHLKGSQNILPRAERIAAGAGLHAAMPLFDRALATFAFELPPSHKLAGATEKVVLKAAMERRLPEDVVHRRKSGMSVPITDWLFGGLRPRMEDLVGDAAIRRRGVCHGVLRRGPGAPSRQVATSAARRPLGAASFENPVTHRGAALGERECQMCMQTLDVIGVARTRHAMPGMHLGVAFVCVGKGVGHLGVGFQHPHTPIRLQTAHSRHQCAAGKPVARGKWVAVGIGGRILNNGRSAMRAPHRNTEPRVRITTDEPANGLGVSR